MNIEIAKAAATAALAGRQTPLTSKDMGDALVEYAKSMAKPGQSAGQSLAALIDVRDPQAEQFSAASDALAFSEAHGKGLARQAGVVQHMEKCAQRQLELGADDN